MARARFQIYADAAGKYRWRLKDEEGEKVASSGESFDTRSNARRAAQVVKGTAPDAEIDDED
ncbi:MAG TPA: YegP family protein [Gaiellaceae bacterium]|nr:YegP family protein [Gaiellaceae bacterium]